MRNKKFQEHATFIWRSFIRDRWGIYLLGIISVLVTNIMQIWAPKNLGWIIDFFDKKAIESQARWELINGQNRSSFCGAYWGWGFHEDGARSAQRVVDQLLKLNG